jgi:hypothetical protein
MWNGEGYCKQSQEFFQSATTHEPRTQNEAISSQGPGQEKQFNFLVDDIPGASRGCSLRPQGHGTGHPDWLTDQ